jgi:cytochrome c553
MIQYSSIFLIILALYSCSSKKESSLEKESLATLSVETLLLSGSAEEGKTVYASCAVCHGAAGEGNVKMNAPAIVNLDSWYAYRQIMNFRNDIRGASPSDTLGYQMAAMAKSLRDSMAVSHVLAYIKSLPATSAPSLIKGDVAKGKLTYQTVCGSCHGPSANGNVKMNAPGLSGLDDWYIKRQINNFKNSIRGSHPKDILGAQMIPMMALLPDDQAIDDVISYIRSTALPVSQ